MNRYAYVLYTAAAPDREPLIALARAFADAVEQNDLLGLDAVNDPSVLALGAFIAFRTHADVNTATGYHQLLTACEDRLHSMELQ